MSDLEKRAIFETEKREVEESKQEREKRIPTFGDEKKTKLKPSKPHFRCLLHLSKFDFQTKSLSENWDTIIILLRCFFVLFYDACRKKERV